MVRACAATILAALFVMGCRKGPDSPEIVANKFLRHVSRDNCAEAWTLFSGPSQAKIRAESAAAIKREPYYAEQFKPENLYCQSTYANRFGSLIPGSAKVQVIEGTNATVTAMRREATGFLIPGFFPTGYKKVPEDVYLVQENGSWKIDVARLTPPELARLAAMNKAREHEREAIERHRARFATNSSLEAPPPPPPAAEPR